ncbi:MAG: phage protease [Dysgonamonadaceae bacterium]|jgi:hypothetical protein|nr:phage protease [Dysgonamonadaceae bacterium]
MAKEAVISTEKLNDRGTWVVTSGIDLEQFRKNPILLWMHTRAWRGTEDEILPIGRIDNLRLEGDRLIGTPVFDQNDEFAKKIEAKWEQGILKMVSAHLQPIELSSEPQYIKPGQKYETVTKSKLIEVSIVDIGGNDDALVLAADGQETNIPLLKNNSQMKTFALKLGLPETASENDILTAIGDLQLKAIAHDGMKSEIETLRLAGIAQEVDKAIAERRITGDRKEHFLALGKQVGIDSLKLTFAAIPAAQKPSGIINQQGGGNSQKFSGSWDELDRKNLLLSLKTEAPELYQQKFEEKFGKINS